MQVKTEVPHLWILIFTSGWNALGLKLIPMPPGAVGCIVPGNAIVIFCPPVCGPELDADGKDDEDDDDDDGVVVVVVEPEDEVGDLLFAGVDGESVSSTSWMCFHLPDSFCLSLTPDNLEIPVLLLPNPVVFAEDGAPNPVDDGGVDE